MSDRPEPASIPALPRGIRMRHDPARGGWVLLAPERIVRLDEIAHAVISHVDGQRSLAEIADTLAREYAAKPADILADITDLAMGLHERGLLEWRAAP